MMNRWVWIGLVSKGIAALSHQYSASYELLDETFTAKNIQITNKNIVLYNNRKMARLLLLHNIRKIKL